MNKDTGMLRDTAVTHAEHQHVARPCLIHVRKLCKMPAGCGDQCL
jgi:hypothetical protein